MLWFNIKINTGWFCSPGCRGPFLSPTQTPTGDMRITTKNLWQYLKRLCVHYFFLFLLLLVTAQATQFFIILGDVNAMGLFFTFLTFHGKFSPHKSVWWTKFPTWAAHLCLSIFPWFKPTLTAPNRSNKSKMSTKFLIYIKKLSGYPESPG